MSGFEICDTDVTSVKVKLLHGNVGRKHLDDLLFTEMI